MGVDSTNISVQFGLSFKIVVLSAIAVALFLTSTMAASKAFAYNNQGSTPCVWSYSGGTSQLEPEWRVHPDYPPTGAYDTAFDDAIADWDSSGTPTVFDHNTSQSNHYTAAEALGTSGPYGRATWGCNWITWKRNTSKASLNTDRLGSKSANFKQSVASHELGHYIGVRHSTVTPAVMVMNTSRNRGTVYETDHADDECAVNDRYENDIWEVDC